MQIKKRWLPIGLITLAALLVVAALLQYRWINRASEADLQERRLSLNGELAGVKGQFNAAVQELLPMFRPAPDLPPQGSPEAHLLRLYLQWQSAANRPPLLGAVYLGTMSEGKSTFSRLDGRSRKFTPEAWPDALVFYRDVLEKRLRMPDGLPPYFPRGFAFEMIGARPIIIFPLVETQPPPNDWRPQPPPHPDRPEPPAPNEPLRSVRDQVRPMPAGQQPGAPELLGWCFMELNSEYLKSELIPRLIERIFGAADLSNYQLAVVGGDGPEMIYQSDAGLTIQTFDHVDSGTVLIGQGTIPPSAPPVPPENAANARADETPPPRDNPRHHGDEKPREDRPPPPRRPPPPATRLLDEFNADASASNSWRLVARHRVGSLEAVVNQTRRHNLALTFGIFLLLSGSIVMLAVVTQRARRLARQQIEFVANITHELRTPLSVIHSASYNLASGVVSEPRRVQDYGAMIQNEARRLSGQVEQALSFAGIQSNRKQYDLQPLRITDIVERAVIDCAPAFAEAGWQVDYEKDDPAPIVLADAQAMESAIKNLLQNALKYADAGKQLRVEVRACGEGKQKVAQIIIADRGPGIASKDLPHLFEPFYRSANVLASATPGAGLGLSIVQKHVQAHRGRVTVSSDGGAVFTIHLPAVDEAATDGSAVRT